MPLWEYFQSNEGARNIVASLIATVAILVLRWILLRQLARAGDRAAQQPVQEFERS